MTNFIKESIEERNKKKSLEYYLDSISKYTTGRPLSFLKTVRKELGRHTVQDIATQESTKPLIEEAKVMVKNDIPFKHQYYSILINRYERELAEFLNKDNLSERDHGKVSALEEAKTKVEFKLIDNHTLAKICNILIHDKLLTEQVYANIFEDNMKRFKSR